MAVDLGPRKFLPPDKKLAKSLLQPYEPFPLSHRIKLSVDELKRDLFPMAVNPRTPQQQLEQLSLLAGDADPFELHKMSWGITFTTDDGSRAVFRFKNREGSRASSIKKSRRYIRDTSRRGARHFKRVLRLAKKLASGGTTVVLLRMPLAPELRKLDVRYNRKRYAKLRRQVAKIDNVHLVDLGADPQLVDELPFYDGHHREFRVAVTATRRIAEILEPFVPRSLFRQL